MNNLHVEHAAMVMALAKSPLSIIEDLTPENAHLLHMAVGICGEVGELLEAFVLAPRNGKPVDQQNVVEELGDIEFYMQGLRTGINLDYDTIAISVKNLIDIPQFESPRIACVELAIVAARILDDVKKAAIYAKSIDRDRLQGNMSVFEIVCSHLRDMCAIDRDETLAANIRKLAKRYEGLKYSNTAAQTRADKPAGA